MVFGVRSRLYEDSGLTRDVADLEGPETGGLQVQETVLTGVYRSVPPFLSSLYGPKPKTQNPKP